MILEVFSNLCLCDSNQSAKPELLGPNGCTHRAGSGKQIPLSFLRCEVGLEMHRASKVTSVATVKEGLLSSV